MPVQTGPHIVLDDGSFMSPPPSAPPPPPPPIDPAIIAAADAAGQQAAAGADVLLAGGSATDIAAAEQAAGAPPDVVQAILDTGIPGVADVTVTSTSAADLADTGEDPLDWADPEIYTELSEDELAAYELEAESADAGAIILFAATHPVPGTIIQGPYGTSGTHSKAFNIAGGSDNWQSENAVDIWLYPGTHVLAVEDGVISPGGWGFGPSGLGGRFAGDRLHLVGDGGQVFYMTHMAALHVVKGQRVKKGDWLGDSGIANGVPHLHLAVRPPFDPHAWAKASYDPKARTTIGLDPKTGAPPPVVDIKQVTDVEDSWAAFMHAFGRTWTSAETAIRDRSRRLAGVVK